MADEPQAGQDEGFTKKERTGSAKFFKFQAPGDTLTGTVVKFYDDEFKGKATKHVILSTVDGVDVDVRLTTQLLDYFEGVTEGQTVKIVFTGSAVTKSGNHCKNFEFYTK